jgi:hypothetical protein
MMPTIGDKPKKALPKKQSIRTEGVRVAKARIMRRDSLRKQRQAQRGAGRSALHTAHEEQ